MSLAGARYWPGGVRYEGDAILICGCCMERGKAGPDTSARSIGVVRGRALSSRNCEVLSTDAGRAGGPVRSSDEAPVMGVERRGRTIEGCLVDQPEFLEGVGWASQCRKGSRSIFRSGKCGRRIGESRPTRVHREWMGRPSRRSRPVSYTHLRAHETRHDLVCRLLL